MRSLLPSDFEETILRYTPRIALQFSGGRDSLAMLYLLKPYWDKLTVYYCNSGDAFPETEELVAKVKEMVPNFIEVPGYVHQTRATDGMPSDLLPARATWRFNTYADKLKIVGREVCCFKSVMLPLQTAMRADGIKLILRGQRQSDMPKNPIKSGDIFDGIRIIYPIDEWNTSQVEEFIQDSGGEIARFYTFGLPSAPVCMGCTAWLEHGTYRYLKRFHPITAKEVKVNIQWLAVELKGASERIKNIAAELHG